VSQSSGGSYVGGPNSWCRETETSSFYWKLLSRFHLRTEKQFKSSKRRVLYIIHYILLYNIQNCDDYINIPSSQTYRSHEKCMAHLCYEVLNVERNIPSSQTYRSHEKCMAHLCYEVLNVERNIPSSQTCRSHKKCVAHLCYEVLNVEKNIPSSQTYRSHKKCVAHLCYEVLNVERNIPSSQTYRSHKKCVAHVGSYEVLNIERKVWLDHGNSKQAIPRQQTKETVKRFDVYYT
jgi:hypothetical protein